MVVNRRSATFALALALVSLTGLVLMPRLNEASARVVRHGLQEFRSKMDDLLGLSVSFDSLSPSILSSASFSGLEIKAPGGRSLLSARKVRVIYNLAAVLRGRSSEAITGLELADVDVDIRLPEDQALLNRLASLFSGGGGAGQPASAPRIVLSGKNVVANLSVEGKGSASFVARELGLSTMEDEPVVTVDGRFSVAPSGDGPWPISGPLSLSGSISRDFTKARASLAIAAESRDFSLAMQRFELVYGNGSLAITKVKDRAPLDAAVRIALSGGDTSASFKLDGFVPSRSVRLSGRYAKLAPWLDIPYRGSIAVSAPSGDVSKLKYEVSLSGSLPARIWGGGSGAASAELAVTGDAEKAEIGVAKVVRGSEFVSYSGSFRFRDLAPDGTLDLNLSLKGGELPIATSLRLAGQGGEYAVLADRVSAGGADFEDLALAAKFKGSQADFKLSFVPPETAPLSDDETPAGGGASSPSAAAFSGEAGSSGGLPLVRCEGSASFGGDAGIELSVELDSVDMGPMKSLIAAVAGSPEAGDILSSLKMSGSLFATSDFRKLSWAAPDLTIVSRSMPGTYALLALSGTTTSVVVKRAVVSVSGTTIEGQGKVEFSDPGRVAFDAKLDLLDFPLALQGSIEGGDVTVTGDYGIAVSVRGQGDERRVSVRARALPVPVGGGLVLATVGAEGRFATIDDWFLSVSELSLVPAGENAAELPRIEAVGDFGPKAAALSSLSLADRYSKVSGTATFEYSLHRPFAGRIDAQLAAAPDSAAARVPLESYKLDLSCSDGNLAGTVDFAASPLARLGKFPVSGYADGRIAVRGGISDPTLDFTVALRNGRLGDQSLDASTAGSYGQGVVKLSGMKAAYQGYSVSGVAASFSLRDSRAELSLDFSGTFNDEPLKFRLIAEGASGKADPQASLAERFASYAVAGSINDFALGSKTVGPWPFKLTSDSGTIAFTGGPSGELRAKYSSGGVISASVRNPLPILPFNADVSCLYDGKNVDLSVQDLEFDLAALQPFMPDVVGLDGGRARGGFHAMGLAQDPEITGEIDLVGASVKVKGWIADDIGPFNAPIVVVGRRIDASVPGVPSGKGQVALGFQASVDHWLPTGISAFARTVPGSYIQLDSVILGVHAKGAAAADVRFAYPGGNTLRIDADVAIENGSVVVSTDTFSSGSDQEDYSRPSLFFDVAANVRFTRRVQVFFPSTTLPIVAAYSDPSSALAVLYDQEASDFSLKGTVALRGGEVFYVQRNFFLKNGKIVFNEGSDRFEPRVTLLAELRDQNNDGPVTITLKAENAPISTFKPTLSSDPVMSEAEIAALMGQNIFGTTESDKSVNIRTTAISASEYIPQLDVARVLENKIRDVSNLDIFYFRTQILQNWLIDMAQSKAETSDNNPLWQYFDNTSLYAGKYLNDSIFAYGSLGIRESTPLVGVSTSIIDYELGLEFDAPFGRLTWALAPDDWRTLKFTDQSIGLSWKLSY